MILDKLIEKKDLRAYIDFRVRCLENSITTPNLKMFKSTERESIKRTVLGRVRELRKLYSDIDCLKLRSKELSKDGTK